MSRENARAKATRYIGEGRLVIRSLDEQGGIAQATCRGDGVVYSLGFDSRTGWWCTCAARGRCSHLYALGLVTALEPPA